MDELLAWTQARSPGEAVVLSLVANVAVFFAALAIGAAIALAFRRRRVAHVPPPLSREDARHHQLPRTNFGFYTAIWDRLFGTLDPGYAKGFARPPKP